jgi:large subunit ribosomal protein L21
LGQHEENAMYAVVRAGGKQYRVAAGDVLRIEKQSGAEGTLDLELLAVGNNGTITKPQGDARVLGQIMNEGRAKKVLVFHYKKKKQYKKLAGHRQPFTSVRITEISFDGQTEKAPELAVKAPKASAAPAEKAAPKKKAAAKKSASGAAKKPAAKKKSSK